MTTEKEQIKRIQEITFESYKASGRIAALMDNTDRTPEALSRELEAAATHLERGALEIRALCESYQGSCDIVGKRPAVIPTEVAGRAESNEFGWLHIQLNTLLPNCRFTSPVWLTETVSRLLDQYELHHGKIPMMERAMLVIDEYSNIATRKVYDQDNKGWKAISNALKGRLVADDDQYSLGVCLLSKKSSEKECHIYVLPIQDVGDFFFMRSENFAFSR